MLKDIIFPTALNRAEHKLKLLFFLSGCMCGFLSFQELPANSVLLIYLSATGVFPTGRSDGEGTIKECSHCEQGLNSVFYKTMAHSPETTSSFLKKLLNLKPGLFV